jgi:hypothetical protein
VFHNLSAEFAENDVHSRRKAVQQLVDAGGVANTRPSDHNETTSRRAVGFESNRKVWWKPGSHKATTKIIDFWIAGSSLSEHSTDSFYPSATLHGQHSTSFLRFCWTFSGAQRCIVSCHLAPWWIPRVCRLSKIGSTVLVVGNSHSDSDSDAPLDRGAIAAFRYFYAVVQPANSVNVFSQFKKPKNNFPTFL